MFESDQNFCQKSLKIESAILSAFQNPRGRQTQMADLLEVSPSAITEIKNNEVARWAKILAAAGLKVVPWDWDEEDPDEKFALKHLAKKYLAGDQE